MRIGEWTITDHALERFCLHEPLATHETVVRELERSEEVDGELARELTGRRPPIDPDKRRRAAADRYLLPVGRRGLFVVQVEGGRQRVVTYLRFGSTQHRFALERWPIRA